MENRRYILIDRKDLIAVVDYMDYSYIGSNALDDELKVDNLTANSDGVKFFYKNLEGVSNEKKEEAFKIFNLLVEEEKQRLRRIDRESMLTIGGVIFLALIVFVGIVGLTKSIKRSNVKTNYKTIVEISSLKSQSAVNGKFSIGRGFVNEEDYYFFLVKDQEGYVKRKAPSAITLLVEKDTIPTFTKYYLIQKSTSSWGFFNIKLEEKTEVDTIDYNYTYKNKYNAVLTIPKGTIEENQNYNPL
ncbi:hypothetical protein NZD88_20975 [Chryseobacterium antibioticum]|uniref:DUF4178 domain-containing protein n=1 Tax=Chryseobacterium pyrolae TaxID=2987481 RepID=A0ABT2IMY4_9FLAO|nr:hypothetical protein [Chryseobacterium pyrolae]MCT2410037.1 hypothetical protein [Chryseobacterium pyrolae]